MPDGPFTQEDPIGLAGGLNLYGYAGSNPINNSDPFGTCTTPLLARMCIGAAVGFVVEAAWQIHTGHFDGGRLLGATLIGALGGAATEIPGVGKYAAQAVLGAGATTLDGKINVGRMVLGGALGVGAEGVGQAVESRIADEGVAAVRGKLLKKFEEMIAHGRNPEDAKAAAGVFDALTSESGRAVEGGTLTGLLTEKLQKDHSGQ